MRRPSHTPPAAVTASRPSLTATGMDQCRLRLAVEQLTLALGSTSSSTWAQLRPRIEIELLANPQLSPHTVALRRRCLRRISPRFDGRSLDGSWRPEALALHREHPRPTASLIVNTLSWGLRAADRWGLRTGDAEISDLAQIYSAQRERWLTIAELGRLDDALDVLRARSRRFGAGIDALRACMLLPLRVGAVCSLTWANVGGDNRAIVAKDKGKIRRWVVGEPTRVLLARMRSEHGPRSPYVFPGRFANTHVVESTLLRTLGLACEIAAIDRRGVCVHTLRHSLATNLLDQGEGLDTAQAALGHSDKHMTRRYVHLVPSRAREAVAELGLAVQAAKGVRS
jgi:integrase